MSESPPHNKKWLAKVKENYHQTNFNAPITTAVNSLETQWPVVEGVQMDLIHWLVQLVLRLWRPLWKQHARVLPVWLPCLHNPRMLLRQIIVIEQGLHKPRCKILIDPLNFYPSISLQFTVHTSAKRKNLCCVGSKFSSSNSSVQTHNVNTPTRKRQQHQLNKRDFSRCIQSSTMFKYERAPMVLQTS